MSFSVSGLPVEVFQPLFGLDEAALAARGIVRYVAQPGDRCPCRITLEDARPGESVLLLNHRHHDVATPYRSDYAIFVNESALATRRAEGELPPVLKNRPIAVRAYSADGTLLGAELALDNDVETVIERSFADPEVAYLHAHNAAHGCYAARIDRG
ncbi:MAG TPA: DUF1203 domain-containing protein [Caulobacteraceae bacterium]|nr:DUF1203 domain-containing protein [Caulobacteraceae bacterium]